MGPDWRHPVFYKKAYGPKLVPVSFFDINVKNWKIIANGFFVGQYRKKRV